MLLSSSSSNTTKYILICEPNIQITKTGLIPLLICEQLYLSGYTNIRVLCLSAPNNKNFRTFIQDLTIFKNNLLEKYPRIPYFKIIQQLKSKKIDFYILSHQQDNPLNFLHLRTFYLNYPLIHNTKEYIIVVIIIALFQRV